VHVRSPGGGASPRRTAYVVHGLRVLSLQSRGRSRAHILGRGVGLDCGAAVNLNALTTPAAERAALLDRLRRLRFAETPANFGEIRALRLEIVRRLAGLK
jgi:hypothetical protein